MSVPSAAPTPEQPRGIDLHLHSTASDGSQAPELVVARGIAAQLAAIALTDHDTVAGIAAAEAAAAGSATEIVRGVELSAYEGSEEHHILGLHLQDAMHMESRLSIFRDARRSRAQKIVERLNAVGVRITFDDVLSLAGDAALGRPHVARALVENGWARDLRDAFDRYLGQGRPGYLDKFRLTIADAVALIHDCGGLAVFAHPGTTGTRERVEGFARHGLDGLEVIHPSHGAEDRARLLALADHFGLVPSGGSDSHGATEGARVIGAMAVPFEWLERQRARVHARARAGAS
ncbi:MAG: PHP domain-containing protein [Gemmatimonadaceae bacterium]